MSSTSFKVGLDGSRNSSKVIKPPGGGSSDIFNVGQSQTTSSAELKKSDTTTQSRLFGTDGSNSCVKKDKESLASVPLSAKKEYVKRNPITGENMDISPYETPKVELEVKQDDQKHSEECAESVKPDVTIASTKGVSSIRVRQPPGGKSSGIFNF